MKPGRFLLGILGGLTFGMLFAPKRGRELRKELVKKSGESPAEVLRALGSALMEAGSEAYDEFLKLSETEQVQALKTLSKEKAGEFLETAKDKGYEIAATVQDKLEEASDFIQGELMASPKAQLHHRKRQK